MDSAVCARSVEMLATMTVRQFPPRLSRSTEVIMELRYCIGSCWMGWFTNG